MGVPVFFKWLCMRNPKIIMDAVEPQESYTNNDNPYVDNFYVDMNGLIHPACNPRGQNIKEPKNFDEQCENIYEYMDKIMNIVMPKKLLYLAVDGVAPRAKMNQQRSRRFRAVQQGEENQQKKQQLLASYKQKGMSNEELQTLANKKSFDSNQITPGTPFLNNVCERIRGYISQRMNSHSQWKNLVVIFSDATCPGQGEHKIMDFIRQQRASEGYDPNLSHCIYGADADLIMLGLATHEPRFFIIREIVITANQKFCTICGKKGHFFMNCTTASSIEDEANQAAKQNEESIGVEFQFINLKMVREYLSLFFEKSEISFGSFDIEKIIDDFIFLCFFCGNDFLPHIPCLTIREGGIDMLMKVYEYCLAMMPSYLTDAGKVNFPSLKIFLKEMSQYQREIIDQIIKKENQNKQREALDKQNKFKQKQKEQQFPIDLGSNIQLFKWQLKKMTNQQNDLQGYSVFGDKVSNYKEKYYREKFHITPSNFIQFRKNISQYFIQALSWICAYYYRGVPSWSWYYPFHYSPFFTDLEVKIESIQFQLGEPFKPYEQLVSVLPPKTAYVLPSCLQKYMSDPQSPLSDYFPEQFMIDLTGKKFAWLGEVLLPFIDGKRLLRTIQGYQQKLTQEEKYLNRKGTDYLYFHRYSPLSRSIGMQKFPEFQQLNCKYEKNNIQGCLKMTKQVKDVYECHFDMPLGRTHNINLKEGIEYTTLEELNEQFIKRTDKRGYGGERFVRVIERSLSARRNYVYHNRKDTKQKDDKGRDRGRQRQRQRGKQRERQRQRGKQRERSRSREKDYRRRHDKY